MSSNSTADNSINRGTTAGAANMGGESQGSTGIGNAVDPWYGQTLPQGIDQTYNGAVGNWNSLGVLVEFHKAILAKPSKAILANQHTMLSGIQYPDSSSSGNSPERKAIMGT